jgi:group I intron endonuclease
MDISGIYQIQSKSKPDRIYIGSAVNIEKRWKAHIGLLQNNKQPNLKLQNHYNKYGIADLMFSILLGCDKEDLIKTEQYFIDSYNPWFNICKKADSQFGLKRSDETKLKLSISHKGKATWNKGKTGVYSKETLLKIGLASKGRILTEEHKYKIGLSSKGNKYCLGQIHSKEHKEKISNSMKGKNTQPKSEEAKKKMSLAKKGIKLTEKHKMNIRISSMNRRAK